MAHTGSEDLHGFIRSVVHMMRGVIAPRWHFAIVAWDGQNLVYEKTDPDNVATSHALRALSLILNPPNKA